MVFWSVKKKTARSIAADLWVLPQILSFLACFYGVIAKGAGRQTPFGLISKYALERQMLSLLA